VDFVAGAELKLGWPEKREDLTGDLHTCSDLLKWYCFKVSLYACIVGLNRVPNFAEYRVFEAVFAEYRYRVFDKM